MRRTRRRIVAAIVAVLWGGAACTPAGGTDRHGPAPPAPPATSATTVVPAAAASTTTAPADLVVHRGILTGGDRQPYDYRTTPTEIVVAATGDATARNIREVFWLDGSPFGVDQEACITWDVLAHDGVAFPTQSGLALRIAPAGTDLRAVTVNQAVWGNRHWLLSVNTWDTTRSGSVHEPLEPIDAWPLVGVPAAEPGGHDSVVGPPWHVCARTDGLELTVKLWTQRDPEPGWDDADHVFTRTLPDGWDHAGYSGGYVGHVVPGESAVFADLTVVSR